MQLFTGDLGAAASLVEETRSVTEATGSTLAPYGEVGLAALRGHEEQAEPLIEGCLEDVVARGEGVGVNMAQWARAVLCNGLGRYGDAVVGGAGGSRRPARARAAQVGARRAGRGRGAQRPAPHGARPRWSSSREMTRASGTDWALGVEARRRALLRDGAAAEELYREAIERLGRTRRARRARPRAAALRRVAAAGRPTRSTPGTQLRTAHETLTAMGVDAFADRARRELLATGETVRKRTVETSQGAHGAGGAHRPARRATGSRTPRSAPRCSSARGPSSGTCARSSPSSASAAAGSCGWRCARRAERDGSA